VTTIIQSTAGFVVASEAKQSIAQRTEGMDCFVATLLAMTSLYGDASGMEQHP
jgi:hypothetical protein